MADIQLADEAGNKFEGHFDMDLWVGLNEDIEMVLSGDTRDRIDRSSKCLGRKDLQMILESTALGFLSRICCQASAKV